MTRKFISTWGMILILLVSVVGTAAAQTGGEATPTPAPTIQPDGLKFSSHPIVQILSAYFGRKGSDTPADPTATPTAAGTVDPSITQTPGPTATATPLPPPGPAEIAEQIAQYHEDGMGFGVLVKLFAIAEASAEKCATPPAPGSVDQPACSVVTVEELVTAVQGGTGMGDLFKQYGKPALLGVGHVKNELKHASQFTATLQATPTAGGAAVQNDKKGGKPSKVKTLKPSKGHGK